MLKAITSSNVQLFESRNSNMQQHNENRAWIKNGDTGHVMRTQHCLRLVEGYGGPGVRQCCSPTEATRSVRNTPRLQNTGSGSRTGEVHYILVIHDKSTGKNARRTDPSNGETDRGRRK